MSLFQALGISLANTGNSRNVYLGTIIGEIGTLKLLLERCAQAFRGLEKGPLQALHSRHIHLLRCQFPVLHYWVYISALAGLFL